MLACRGVNLSSTGSPVTPQPAQVACLKGRSKVLHVLISSDENESPADIDYPGIAMPEALVLDLFNTLERTVPDQSFSSTYL